jgi:DDE superfamily endonuclease
MEDVLDVYTAEHREEEPLIAMDEASKQLLADTQDKIPLEPGKIAKEDYHYERHGVQALFIFFDPIRNWRRVSNRDHRTRVDWALEIKQLLDVDYPQAKKVKLVCDNLNTHSITSLYEAFTPEEAHRLARRLEIHYTPRNGSWLNIAEIELGILSQQCLDRRIPTPDQLNKEISAWQNQRNLDAGTVVWRFTTEQARIKLQHLYPRTVLV